MIQIFLDENISEYVADALNNLNKGQFSDVQVASTKLRFGKGIKDPVLIPKIGEENGILITQDINMSRDKLESSLLKKHGVGVFYITLSKGHTTHWNMVKLLVTKWEEIIAVCQNKKPPFAYRVSTKSNVKKLEL